MARQKLSYFDNPQKVGQRIRATREAAGLSQRDLAFPGCTSAYISRIERGERVPSLQILREFASRLGVTEVFLAQGEGFAAVPSPDPSVIQARAALWVSDFDAAREFTDALLNGARDDHTRAIASGLFGQVALAEGNLDEAIDALERARQLAADIESTEPEFGEALGRAHARRGDYESAIGVFQRNYDLAVRTASPLETLRFGSLLANSYADTGNYPKAEEILGAVIAVADQTRDPLSRAKLLWTQSRLHGVQQNSALAASYATRAIEILEVTGLDYHAAVAYQLLAHIELDRGNTERAVELLERGEPRIVAAGRPFEAASFRLEQARALARSGREEEAAALLMSLSTAFADGRPIDSGRSYALLGDTWREIGEEERAIELYELALERFSGVHSPYALEVYSQLADLLERRGKKDEAYALLKEAMALQQHLRSPSTSIDT